MRLKSYIVDAFTDRVFGGNPAGVVYVENSLSAESMQNVAKEFGLSETVFIKRLSENVFETRFFTPTEEVALCGHATIAGFYTLAKEGYFNTQSFPFHVEQQTSTENLEVIIDYDKGDYLIKMGLATPVLYHEEIDEEELIRVMGTERACLHDLPPRIVSTGLRDVILPLRTRGCLNRLQANEKALAEFSRKHRVTGVHAFSLDAEAGVTACCRNFAPLVGIPEEAATGTANGGLTYYLIMEGLYRLREGEKRTFTFEQGKGMGRPSRIQSTAVKTSGGVRISIAGGARIFMAGEIVIP